MWSDKHNGEGDNPSPGPPRCACVSTVLVALGFCCQGTLLAHARLAIYQYLPRTFSAELLHRQSGTSLYPCRGPFLPRCKIWYLLLLTSRRLSLAHFPSLLPYVRDCQVDLSFLCHPQNDTRVHSVTYSSSDSCNINWGSLFPFLTKLYKLRGYDKVGYLQWISIL